MAEFATKPDTTPTGGGGIVSDVLHHVADETMNIASALPGGHALTGDYYRGSGGASPHDLQVALGHYVDDHPEPAQQPSADDVGNFAKHMPMPTSDNPEAPHTRVAGYMLGTNYVRSHDDKENYIPGTLPSEDTKLDLSTPEARLKSLNQLTQNNQQNNLSGEDTCAASALVGGAVLAQGGDGIKKLLNGIDANATEDDRKRLDSGHFKDLREKLDKNLPLTNADMHLLQGDLYSVLQSEKKIEPGVINAPGVDPDTMAKFLSNAPEMSKMLQDNHMGVSTIDMNGEGHAHAVLSIRNPDPSNPNGDATSANAAVYDPYARKGGQVITDKGSLVQYQLAEMQKKGGGSSFEQ
jgi:hypothetical protein